MKRDQRRGIKVVGGRLARGWIGGGVEVVVVVVPGGRGGGLSATRVASRVVSSICNFLSRSKVGGGGISCSNDVTQAEGSFVVVELRMD